jgi:uncharacterized membrane protein
MRPRISALIVIAIGLLFLMQNLGVAHVDLGHLIAKWWPLILIAVGISMLFKRNSNR